MVQSVRFWKILKSNVLGIGRAQSQRLCWQVGLSMRGSIDHLSQEEVESKLSFNRTFVSWVSYTVWSYVK
jgi:ribosomal protein S13